jgi:hypothetical protein
LYCQEAHSHADARVLWHQVQLLSYLEGGYLCQAVEVPTAKKKSEQIFFAYPKAHQFKFTDLNKTVPTDLLKLIAFFEQCQATDKVAGILEKIAKDKKQPKEKKKAHLPAGHSHEFSYQQHFCLSIVIIIEVTNTIAKTADLIIAIDIEMINTRIVLVATIRT